MICLKFQISGRVQGVFYRASTQSYAVGLSLSGYAKNLANGDVEVLACGRADSLDTLERWLWQGPEFARVETIDKKPLELDVIPVSFETE